MEPQSESLRKTNVGIFGLVFQGIGQIAPIGIFAGSILGAASFAWGATPLSFIIGFVAALLAGNTVFQYSKKVASARGYYSYAGGGLGYFAATFVAFMYVLYQLANIGFITINRLWSFASIINGITGSHIPQLSGLLFVIIWIAFVIIVAIRGLKPSVRTQIFLSLISLAFVFVVSAIIIIKAPDNTLAVFTPINPPGINGVFLGFITGTFLAFAGYGSLVPLGEEVKAPKKTIGISVILLISITAIVDIVGSYAMTVGWGYKIMSSFTSSVRPGFFEVNKYVGLLPEYIFLAIFLAVLYSLVLTMFTALTRVLYAMGRDGILPNFLSKTHKKFGTPVNAIYVGVIFMLILITPISFGFYFLAGFSGGLLDTWLVFALMASLGSILIHIITNSSLSVDKRFKEKTLSHVVIHIIVPSVTSVLFIVALAYSLNGIPTYLLVAPILILVYSIGVVLFTYNKRHRLKKLDFQGIDENLTISNTGR
jgi:amino acid transporter